MRFPREERQGDFRVTIRRDDHRDRVTGIAERFKRRETAAVELRANFGGPSVVGLENADEFNAGQARVDARVVLAEGADPDDAAADFGFSHG
jgi:hypothetical protein